MATPRDVAAEHRDIAGRFTHLDGMPAEEARHRAAYIHDIERRSPLTGEVQQLMLAHTARLAAALPVREYLAQLAHLNDLAVAAPGTGLDSAAFDFRRAADKLRGEHVYAPGLVRACERFLEGKDPAYEECDIEAVLNPIKETA